MIKNSNDGIKEITNAPRPVLARIFLSPEEKRLRAGWRLIVQMLLSFILQVIPLIIIGIILAIILAIASVDISDDLLTLPGILVSAAATTLSVWIARRWIDRRTIASLGLQWQRNSLMDVLVGIIIAGIMMGLIFVLQLSMGWLQIEKLGITGIDKLPLLLLWAIVFLVVGFYEELLSRGYHLQNIEDGLNTAWAVLISSAIFSLAHLFNPNPSLGSVLGILAAGLFLAYAYLSTRQLWLPIGLHIGWNFFEGPVFGFPVSGLITPRLIEHTVSGPLAMTGGAFGPEAGWVQLPALILGILLIILYNQQTENNGDEKEEI